METLLDDIRYAARSLRRAPGFTLVAVVTLALGIGANTAIFSVVNRLLFRPFPFLDTDRLVNVWATAPRGVNDHNEASPADFRDWRAGAQGFDHLVAHVWWTANFTGGEQPERIQGFRVSPDYFDALGLRPLLGRTFQAGDDEPGKDALVILSHGLWQRRFGGDAEVIGTTVSINGISRQVIGVMPPAVRYPAPAEAWAPFSMTAEGWANRRAHFLLVTGRLKAGVTADQGRAELATLGARLAEQYPGTNTGWGVDIRPLLSDSTRMIAPMLYVLFGAVGFVLLIACANVANLMLARASGRGRELAIRVALGAVRVRIARLVLTESVLLAVAGGVTGILIAFWGVDLLVSLVPPEHQRFMAGVDAVRIDGPVLAFAMGLALLSVLFFGLVPSLRASRGGEDELLRAGASSEGRGRHRLRRSLVGIEVALALLLLVGAGLTWRSFRFLGTVDPGLDGRGVALTWFVLPGRVYSSESSMVRFTDALVGHVAAIPGVRAAATTNIVPMCSCNSTSSFNVAGQEPYPPGERPDVGWRVVTPGYFAAMGMTLRAGRLFSETDRAGSAPVVIVTEAVSRRWFPDGGALGRMLYLPGDSTRPAEVVGIIGDLRHDGPVRPVSAELYLPQAQRPENGLTIVARTDGDPAPLLPLLRRAVREVDADLPVYDQTTMASVMNLAVGPYRFSMRLLAGLGLVALLLASVGIYGVIAHLVSQRTREIGIRVALGGDEGTVRRLVVRQGMAPAFYGVLAGIAAALSLGSVLARLTAGVSPRDPVTLAAVAVLLLAVALAACWVPAQRAARVDPIEALRVD